MKVDGFRGAPAVKNRGERPERHLASAFAVKRNESRPDQVEMRAIPQRRLYDPPAPLQVARSLLHAAARSLGIRTRL